MKKHLTYIATASVLLAPALTFAAGQDLNDLVKKIIGYTNQALFLMMSVAVVMFVLYVIKYFIKPDANRAEGGTYVMWSVIGFFVILSFWGLINILQNTFGLQNDTNRPTAWTSFTNIFPSGGGSSTNTKVSGSVNTTNNFRSIGTGPE